MRQFWSAAWTRFTEADGVIAVCRYTVVLPIAEYRREHQPASMCGRYNIIDSPEVQNLMSRLGLPLYKIKTFLNIAPTATVPIVVEEDGERRVVDAIWWMLLKKSERGLVPNSKWRSFNAVASRASKSRLYASALEKSRCIVFGSNYYEFKSGNGSKQVFFVAPESGAIAFAGLYRKWEHGGEAFYSCAIMTTGAHPKLEHIRKDRSPVMLAQPDYGDWLSNTELDEERRNTIFKPRLNEPFVVYPVDWSVHTVATKNDACTTPIGEAKKIAAD